MSLKDPANLVFESTFTRRCILAAYWVVILLALPVWWSTTSIKRLSLPVAQVSTQLHRQLTFPDVPPVEPLHDHVVAKYASRYRLAFTLLNEDAAAGPAASGWHIHAAINKHIQPVLLGLHDLHNFTVESQVQFQAPLAFSPTFISDDQHETSFCVLTAEDLTVFVNSAEWTLSSSASNDPVLHFVLFVPSSTRRPLRILDKNGSLSPSNAFILPQWGGIVIYNPAEEGSDHIQLTLPHHLDTPFLTFRNQLLTLLGVSKLKSTAFSNPDSSHSGSHPSSPITDHQLNTLLRLRATENILNAQHTLRSIVQLVDQIPNMPVGQDVKGDVQDALTALDEAFTASHISPTLTLHHSASAQRLASRAFFNPNMLALLYFPPEHRYAVYTPLFASATVPLVAAVVREWLAWRRERRGVNVNAGSGSTRNEGGEVGA